MRQPIPLPYVPASALLSRYPDLDESKELVRTPSCTAWRETTQRIRAKPQRLIFIPTLSHLSKE